MDKNYNIKDKPDNSDFLIRGALEETLKHWYWFVVSLIFTLLLAYIYLRIVPPSYMLKEIMMVDNQSKNLGPQNGYSTVTDIDGWTENNTAAKAIYILQSKQLMLQVIKKLKLNVSYRTKDKFSDKELYTDSPIIISFLNSSDQPSEFTIEPESERTYQISQLKLQGKEMVSYVKIGTYGNTLSTPLGPVLVSKSANKGKFTQPIRVCSIQPEEIANYYKNAVDAEIEDDKAGIIRISLIDNNYNRAVDILNALVQAYNNYTKNERDETARNTSDFIGERVKLISAELGDFDTKIEDYKKSNRLTDITNDAKLYLTTGSEYQSEAALAKTQINIVNHISAYLNNPENEQQLLPANTGIDNDGLENLIMFYNQALSNRNKLSENSSNTSPAVIKLNKILADTRTTLRRSIETLKASLMIKLAGISKQEKLAVNNISKIPTQQKQVQGIARQQTIKEGLYLFLLQKREETALNLAMTTANAQVIDYADGSSNPVKPNKAGIISIAFFAGLALPAGIIYLKQMVDTKVRTKNDIEFRISIPVLGDLPMGDKVTRETFVVNKAGRNPVSEALRIIRTNLKFVLPSPEGGKTIMVTSTFQGEGKTFISVNLAMSIAMTEKRVLLMNGDIRKKDIAAPFRHNSGLTNYLIGDGTELQALISKAEFHSHLDIMNAGPYPPNPAELLNSDRFDKLIKELSAQYDYIILDNVPVNPVADALIINRVADLSLYIIRAGKLDRRALPEIEALHRDKFKNIAIILNGSDEKRNGYGYGYD